MTQTVFFDPPPSGSLVFPPGSDPAMSGSLVHFVERQRSLSDVLPTRLRRWGPDGRLANLLVYGELMTRLVYGSNGVRVACVSDLSMAELEAAFAFGLNTRGPVGPWAVVLDRIALWSMGFRPVIYAESSKVSAIKDAIEPIVGRHGRALVVRTELGADDWTAEREWRYCLPMEDTPDWHQVGPAELDPRIDVRGAIRAVIVGRSGWRPDFHRDAYVLSPVPRWVWDVEQRKLVHDGQLLLW